MPATEAALTAPVAVPLPRSVHDQHGRVRCPQRLSVVAELDLAGHAEDPDLDGIVETLATALDVPIAVVNIVTPDLQTYPAEIGVGAPCTRVPDGLSFCAEVVETGRALQVEDARLHPVYRDNMLVQQGVITSYAGFPLLHRGVVIGAVSVFDAAPRSFTDRELRILSAQARLAATVLTLRWTATHDPLTELSNRRGLARGGAVLPAALLFVDVDDFKRINDTFGHAQGDALLRELAVLLRRSVEGTAGLAVRWGGDEFLLLLPGAERAAAERTAQALAQAVREQASLPLSVTIGLAVSSGSDDWQDLVLAASAAAAAGKRTGKDRVVRAAAPLGAAHGV